MRLSMRIAVEPATSGAAILVPPNMENDSALESFFALRTLLGTKPYAPVSTRSGLGSPTMLGPLLEKSTRLFALSVVFPNLGCPLKGPEPT